MRQKKQIGLWLDPATCDLLHELAAGQHVNTFVETLIQQEAARRRGEVLETNTFPVMRAMMQEELLKAFSHQQSQQYEQQQRVLQAMKDDLRREVKDSERRAGDRIVALVIRALREGLISRRMLYALIARQDARFADAAFEDARAKAGRDIASKVSDADV